MNTRSLVLCASLLAVGAPLGAQSIFNSAGIGLPVEALDGRARSLGSFGIGLQGPALGPSDPAAAAGVLLPTALIVGQPSWVDLTEDGSGDHQYFRGTRFPLLGLAYPAFSGTWTLLVASVFDQGYAGERSIDVVLGGASVPATDRFLQEGSLSAISLGYARMLDERTAVGLSLGRYAGTVRRRLAREYGFSTSVGQVDSYQAAGSWQYSGESITAGVATDLAGEVRVAASATWSTDLGADATGSTEGGDRAYDVPLQLRIGASSVLMSGLTLSASAVRADWSGAVDGLGGTSRAGSVMGFGAGLELSQARLFGREAPLRVGFRRVGLPFSLGSGDANEQVFSWGLALILNQSAGVVLATTDIGLEKGRRSGGPFTEEFWRATVSLRLSGF